MGPDMAGDIQATVGCHGVGESWPEELDNLELNIVHDCRVASAIASCHPLLPVPFTKITLVFYQL
ncbi:KCTD10 isoform 5 [Pan troglodytes]|uniref:KCTD10 isoform 5 n=1 Tax=Pan troglodytes TaxID=9598 RepID=A0A2J8MZ86_PANTR|nr:KCTD10 isoform 5 [Pan troglodytes]